MKTNEFGIRMDRNGYAPSILEPAEGPCCALCGRSFGAKLDRHEPWGGANREKSKALGLWVSLCHFGCHEGPGSVHDDPALNRALRRRAQAQAMAVYGWDLDEWRRRFGKSEIREGEELGAVLMEQGFSLFRPAGHLPPLGEGKERRGAAVCGKTPGTSRAAHGRRVEGAAPYGEAAAMSASRPTECGFRVCLDGPELPL